MNHAENSKGSVMALGAHPDDIETIVGQAIYNQAEAGLPTFGLVATLGTESTLHLGCDISFCPKRV